MARATATITLSKESVVKFLADPFAFFGSLGHFALPLYWIDESGSWGPLSRSKSAKLIKAVWVFLDPEKPNKPASLVGTISGPRLSEYGGFSFVSYNFKSDDGSTELKIDMKVSGNEGTSTVDAEFEVQSRMSFWGSILRKVSVSDDAGAHLLNDHFVPYLTNYLAKGRSP